MIGIEDVLNHEIDLAAAANLRGVRLCRTRDQMLEAVLACSTVLDARRLVRTEVASLIYDHGCLAEDRARKIVRDNIRYLVGQLQGGQATELAAVFAAEEGREAPCN